MEIAMYQVDAFTDRLFHGNPAAVCLLEEWLPESVMQQIAAENNLSETAFVKAEEEDYRLRWFTPEAEIDLCGHATLATAHVLFRHKKVGEKVLSFKTMSGRLEVSQAGERLRMLFPARPAVACELPDALQSGLGIAEISEIYKARDYLVVLESEELVRALQPDFKVLSSIQATGIIVTAAAESAAADFVSRYFAPGCGVPEDPVTGSAHCTLMPYWSKHLGRKNLTALQLSKRGGVLRCEDRGEMIVIEGMAVTYLQGVINVNW